MCPWKRVKSSVHDLHRAHFVLNSTSLQDVFPDRLPFSVLCRAKLMTCAQFVKSLLLCRQNLRNYLEK